MFPFDQSQLPTVFSRKAFIGVDFQRDFTSTTGALPVTEPEGYVQRAMKLAETFRKCGNAVIWTKSCQGAQPVPADDRILASDSVAAIPLRSRRRAPEPEALLDGPPDREAFLSHAEPFCLNPDTVGLLPSEEITTRGSPTDSETMNADYSAFNGSNLLRLLRSKMIMELFICGTLVNVGVYATAIEAAGHGMAITIVEDCCGYRSDARQALAFSRLTHLTGCEFITANEVTQMLKPPVPKTALSSRPAPKERKAELPLEPAGQKQSSQSGEASDLIEKLSSLQLEADSPKSINGKDWSKSNAASGTPASRMDGQKAASSPQIPKAMVDDDTNTSKTIEGLLPDISKLSITPDAIEVDNGLSGDTADETPDQQRGICAGDTDVIENVLPPVLEKDVFEKLRTEVDWQHMSHQGGEVPRLVAVQGELGQDGSIPVYRHPSDESPPLLAFTPTVQAIKTETEKHLGHPLNHVLIQFYRDGNDYISEHSDKTIDVVRGSYIANVSLGAQRTMVLRTKRKDKELTLSEASQQAAVPESITNDRGKSPNAEAEEGLNEEEAANSRDTQEEVTSNKRQVQRAVLRHNSLCRMGLKTNMEWLHSIRQDKRADRDKSAEELAFGGARISLTFRRIGTFLNRQETMIWGQGATGKTKEDAHPVINGESPEMVEMLKAFGRENHSSSFDWDAHYGKGFDVLHMSNTPRLFASQDVIINQRVALMLAEYNIGYAKGSMTASKTGALNDEQLEAVSIKFMDGKATVQGDLAIMLYLHEQYGSKPKATDRVNLARSLTLFQRALVFLTRWRRIQSSCAGAGKGPDLKPLRDELAFWDKAVSSSTQQGEDKPGNISLNGQSDAPELVDFALFPVIHEVVKVCGRAWLDDEHKALRGWYEWFKARESVQKVVGS